MKEYEDEIAARSKTRRKAATPKRPNADAKDASDAKNGGAA